MSWTARTLSWLTVLSVPASCGPPREAVTPPTPSGDSVAQVEASENDAICRPVAFPDTPAGHRLEHLHTAITAADASLTERFVDEEMSAEFLAAIPRERHIQVLRSLHDDEGRTLLCGVDRLHGEVDGSSQRSRQTAPRNDSQSHDVFPRDP